MSRAQLRQAAILVLLTAVVGLVAAACANRVQTLPTPTIEALEERPPTRLSLPRPEPRRSRLPTQAPPHRRPQFRLLSVEDPTTRFTSEGLRTRP